MAVDRMVVLIGDLKVTEGCCRSNNEQLWPIARAEQPYA